MSPRVFLITGTSTGFGKEYAQEVLNRGDIVVATARNPSSLEFSGTNSSNYLAVRLDVTDRNSIKEAFDATLDKFKRVDVVVNNAGYGLAGNFEEYTDDQIRQQMEVNLFGLMDVTRQAMQVMRDRQVPQGGLIQQVTSIGGQRGVPLFSAYCASKWAVEGFTESVSLEVKPEWGIKFTCVEPGGFRYVYPTTRGLAHMNSSQNHMPLQTANSPHRTDWPGRSMTFADRHPAYDRAFSIPFPD